LNTYGFETSGVEYDKFVVDYLPVLARREARWSSIDARESKSGVLAAHKCASIEAMSRQP